MNIQWYPGHMTKARRMLEAEVKLVDAVCEILDARIPFASRNPDLDAIIGQKPRLTLLGRADQADPAVTALWKRVLPDAIEGDATSKAIAAKLVEAVKRLLREKLEVFFEKGQVGRSVKLMVVGIPNVGKSTLINTLAGHRAAKAEDRPGVTRGKQWISVGSGLLLLDTPGILWPRFDDERTGRHLAYTGAIRDEIMDMETLGAGLMETLAKLYPAFLEARYKIAPVGDGLDMLQSAARKRGFLVSGGECDLDRMARVLLDEFRAGKLGRISLERPEC